jgi:hypothetical protein
MWRSVESKIGEVEQGVKDAIADMEYAINKRAELGNK